MSKRLNKAIVEGTWEEDLIRGDLGMIDIMDRHKEITDTFNLEDLLILKDQIYLVLQTEEDIIERGALYEIASYIEECIIRRSK